MSSSSIPVDGKKDDGWLAAAILITTLVLVISVGLYFWRKRSSNSSIDNSWKQNSFSPPAERSAYIEAKESSETSNDELKKLLMRRAIKTIPILLSLQTEGSSIERLYKKGMLTDDMHFKVKELKAFVDQEFQDVQFEADELLEGWGQNIWPQAMQFHQMIQKQAESKTEEVKQAEEEKKKSEAQKKKDKEKAKKLLNKDSKSPVVESTSIVTDPIESVPVPVNEPVLDPEQQKILDAEKLAQQLIEEEEKEKQLKAKQNTKKVQKK